MKLKEGYARHYDSDKHITHIYPINGRSHLLDNCWCEARFNKKNMIMYHNDSKENRDKCKN